ncbi:unnamed protein product [Lactuca saligna]|uniref:Germin-like protein n=1 Tax=Lactuca saligna TaxID=75948 RepID=A0AA36EPT2_LACSI|nr:unnamed protein product [Lactuca saligna]
MTSHLLLFGLLVAGCSLAFASDPSPLQDFCVADQNSTVFVNGLVCKEARLVQADDFFYSGLQLMGNTSNAGINPPHTHPWATEILTVMEGRILVGFVTSNPENRLITKLLQKRDVFVFPQGLIHFQKNVGNSYAVAIAALSSQNPGVITIANAVF